jgi:hypothetical protein
MSERSPRSVERSAEPVVAWRAWRLRREGVGALRLQPAFRGPPWGPLEPVRARCVRRRRHDAPKRRCTCGLYGFRDGSEVGLGGTRLAAVGQVSMWGRVVEHDLGFRAEFAYPARLRLVCSVCLTMGERPAIPVVVAQEGDHLLPLCEEHERSHRGHNELRSAREVEAELLSTYAVDVLPPGALPPPPEDEQIPAPRWWRGGPGKGIVALLMASLLLRAILLWAAVSSGTLGSDGLAGRSVVESSVGASVGDRRGSGGVAETSAAASGPVGSENACTPGARVDASMCASTTDGSGSTTDGSGSEPAPGHGPPGPPSPSARR